MGRTEPASNRPGPARLPLPTLIRHHLRHRVGPWGLIGLAVMLAAAALHLGWSRPRADQADALAQALEDRRTWRPQPAAPAGAGPQASVDAAAWALWERLPPPGRLADDTLAVVRAVQAASLTLERLDLRRVDAPARLPQEALQLRLQGPYRRVRLLLQDLQAQLPHAALDDLLLERSVESPGPVEPGAEGSGTGTAPAAASPQPGQAGPDAVRAQLVLRLHYREPAP